MSGLWDTLLNLLFPEKCLGCGNSGSLLCLDCLSDLPRAWDNQPNMIACFEYRDPHTREAIHKLKYKRGQRLATTLGVSLGELILEDLSDETLFSNTTGTILVPAPLSKERLRERGFNQAELLAEVVSVITGIPVAGNVIEKTKHTSTQVSLKNRSERLANPIGAFKITRPEDIASKRIIVIDDVYTTGATANEIMRVLKKAGAKSAITYTIAH